MNYIIVVSQSAALCYAVTPLNEAIFTMSRIWKEVIHACIVCKSGIIYRLSFYILLSNYTETAEAKCLTTQLEYNRHFIL